MANKFQKSVLERLEQEATRQKQKGKSKAAQTVITIEQAPILQQETVSESFASEIQTPKQESQALPDIGEYLQRDNQRLAKNKTFYLDNDVIEAIKKTAKTQQVTDSKLVNDILRHVLGLS